MANIPGRAGKSPPRGKGAVQARAFGIGHSGNMRALRTTDEEAEQARLDEEAEQARTDEEAEQARTDEEAEQARTDEEAEQARTDEEAEQARTDEEAEQARLDEEAEQARLDEEAEQAARVDQTAGSRAEWLEQIHYNEAARTVRLPFSSEIAVPRWYGTEILSHAPGAVRIDGARQRFMSLLFNHDMGDLLGRVELVELESGKLYGTVRFGRDERGEWALQQVLDEILTNVSIRYEVYKWMEDVEEQSYTAMDWEPFEFSLVTVPADASVGGGRSLGGDQLTKGNNMKFNQRKHDKVESSRAPGGSGSVAAERARVTEINALARAHNVPQNVVDQYISEGTDIATVRGLVLTSIASRSGSPVADMGMNFNPDLTQREKNRYSMLRGLRASLSKDWKEAGFEREVSDAILKSSGRQLTQEGAFLVPTNIGFYSSQRDFNSGALGTGGALVGTELRAGDFIELLRNKARVLQLGARVLSGLVGNIDIPRQITAAAPGWFTENNNMPNSTGTFNKLSLAMKSIGSYGLITRNMLMQSTPDVEMLYRADLIAQLALGIDLAALSGTGLNGQPLGIANTNGINSIIGGTNGAAVTLDHIIDMETAVEEANVDEGSLAYLVNPRTKGHLKKQKSTTGQYLWTTSPTGARSATPGELNGHAAAVTNQARKSLTKGTSNGICSELFFGDWSEVIFAEWGVLEILPNPYSDAAFASGGVLVRATQSADIGTRHAQAFSVFSDALTPQA